MGHGRTIPIRPDVLRAIADTLDARADADELLTATEMRSLADALKEMAGDPFNAGSQHTRAENNIVSLRPVWRGPGKGVTPQ